MKNKILLNNYAAWSRGRFEVDFDETSDSLS